MFFFGDDKREKEVRERDKLFLSLLLVIVIIVRQRLVVEKNMSHSELQLDS